MAVVVVIPSRGRPARAYEALAAIRETAQMVSTRAVLVVDADDPAWRTYSLIGFPLYGPEVSMVTLVGEETGNLVRATNTVSMRIAREDPTAIIGNLGDDHVMRTPGWDKRIAEALATPGIAYGDDGIQHEELPTAPFISASIVLALGYYALPDVDHMYCDNAWRDVGVQTGTLRYLPDVVIEHVHPAVGKAEWDPGYIRVNAEDAIARDKARYESWREHAMTTDIGRVRDALAVPA